MEEKVVETDMLPFGVMIRVNGILYLGEYKEDSKEPENKHKK